MWYRCIRKPGKRRPERSEGPRPYSSKPNCSAVFKQEISPRRPWASSSRGRVVVEGLLVKTTGEKSRSKTLPNQYLVLVIFRFRLQVFQYIAGGNNGFVGNIMIEPIHPRRYIVMVITNIG